MIWLISFELPEKILGIKKHVTVEKCLQYNYLVNANYEIIFSQSMYEKCELCWCLSKILHNSLFNLTTIVVNF